MDMRCSRYDIVNSNMAADIVYATSTKSNGRLLSVLDILLDPPSHRSYHTYIHTRSRIDARV